MALWEEGKIREKKERRWVGAVSGVKKAWLFFDASRVLKSSIKIYDSHEWLEERGWCGNHQMLNKDPSPPRFLLIRHLFALSQYLLRDGSCSGHSSSFEQGLEPLGSSQALPLTS